jgi:hypothetical protein
VGLCCEMSKFSGEKSNTSVINRGLGWENKFYNVRETFLEEKGEKVRKREEQEEVVDFCNNQVRVRLTFNIIKGMIL